MDACSFISLIQSELFERFMEVARNNVVIDSSVYSEVVIKGKEKNYPDAVIADEKMMQHKIPIIPIDVSQYIELFRDPGETSCYILGLESGVTITSDDRAYKKFKANKISVIKIEQFFLKKYQNGLIKTTEIKQILQKLENVNAISSKLHFKIMERIKNG
ncbi:MAG: hypothetical protein ACTSRK_15280 [Promethearchaeota archaeon]